MKKKILVVNKSFKLGGIQTSLINLLHEIKDDYEIDLLVFYNDGILKSRVPKEINILEPSILVRSLGMSMRDIKKCRNPVKVFFRFFSGIWSKLFSNTVPIRIALGTQKKLKGYDVAIAYHQESNKKFVVSGFSRFILKCVDAKMKISWIHADSINARLNTTHHRNIYKRIDKIICVSQNSMESFIRSFPEYKGKTSYLYNINPYNEIIKKSESSSSLITRENNELILFTACRLSKEKGITRSIKSIARLIDGGYKLKWFIAGDGSEKQIIIDEIEKHSLQDTIILLGYLSNPYPYMKEADLLFISSFHEAAPMVVDEANALGVPILSTDIPVIKEKCSENSGYICKNNGEGIYQGIKYILDNPSILNSWREYLSRQTYSNEETLMSIKSLFNQA